MPRPIGREKNVLEGSAKIDAHKVGGGPAGSGSAMGGGSGSGGGGKRNGRGGGLPLIVVLLVALLGGGGSIGGLLGGGGSGSGGTASTAPQVQTAAPTTAPQTQAQTQSQSASGGFGALESLLGGGLLQEGLSGSSSGWGSTSGAFGSGSGAPSYSSTAGNTGTLTETAAPGARQKFTKLKGNGKDVVTIMVYLCGTDLESRNAMATSDLMEMTKADIGDNVNLIVYTGGCRKWQNQIMSASKNQIYQVVDGGLKRLVADDGSKAMTDWRTLASFIQYGARNFPADRNMLIFWDHGGGSVSGYGYDEKVGSGTSMTLGDIKKALDAGGLKYDVIGFDACLMATVENALMLSEYGDYMIASEETEPGIGWYYTDWLNQLSRNTSVPTTELGKTLIDSFISACNSRCPGQQTTLSLVDLAELGETVGDDFKAFASSTASMISDGSYSMVATARGNTREFAKSTRIDQIDLVHFAKNLGTKEGDALAEALLSTVKYNRTSRNMTNAYGLSIYFPTRKVGALDKALKTYQDIGLDDAYGDCIREFAAQQTAGQHFSYGQQSSGQSYGSLFEALMGAGGSYGGSSGGYGTSSGGSSYGGSSYGGSSAHGTSTAYGSGEDLAELFGMLFRSGGGSGDRALPVEDAEAYAKANSFDPSLLVWSEDAEGRPVIALDETAWSLLTEVNLNMYVDTGDGWFDLGLDNLFEIGEDGTLIADNSGTWLTIDGVPIAYYHTDTTENEGKYTITGYVPALLNDDRVDLTLIFDSDNPKGFIAGAKPHYDELTETETVAKGLIELQDGDVITPLYDHYNKDCTFDSLYASNQTITVSGDMVIGDMKIEGNKAALYRLTDIYQQHYWTPAIP